jgi:hypothetical protein
LRGVVKVRRKRLRLASGEVIEGEPKSRAGRRDVFLPEPVVEELEAHLERFVDATLDAYVFTSPRGDAAGAQQLPVPGLEAGDGSRRPPGLEVS